MTIHTALVDLPSLLEDLGLNVMLATDWLEGQCNGGSHYLWTDPFSNASSHDEKPNGYMVHHTAGSAATPPPHDTSKAGAWIGLERGGRLYQEGGGTPTIYLATAGPARISSGYGYRPALWDNTFLDQRAPARASGGDGQTAGNRYTFNVETVHRGDGSAVDRGVWDHVVGLGVALSTLFDWTERTLGHRSWSTRKIDPKWQVGLPHDGVDCIIDIQDEIARILNGGELPEIPPPVDPPPSGGEYMFPTIREGDGYFDGANPQYRAAVKACQIMLAHHDYRDLESVDSSCSSDGAFGPGTTTQVQNFQRDKNLTADGVVGPKTWDELNKPRSE